MHLARCTRMPSHDLEHFVSAQEQTYVRALDEVRAGAKRSHWMWYIFPQIAGLGHSPMAQRYAIADLEEARAYLGHPILGGRLREIVMVLQDLPDAEPEAVFGHVDAMKLRSSLTLFALADAEPTSLFHQALDRWFDGREDPATVARL
jgi:uncharacterized protein (DUF1810 family)